MRAFLSLGQAPFWALFLGCSVYGHLALKRAVGGAEPSLPALLKSVCGGWGLSAALAWTVSSVLWTVALSQQSVGRANTVSSLRFVCLNLAAWLFLGERMTWAQGLGAGFMVAGIYLVVRA